MPKQKKYLRDQNGLEQRVWDDYCSEKYTAKEMCKKHHMGMTRYYKILKSYSKHKGDKGKVGGSNQDNNSIEVQNNSRFDEFKKKYIKIIRGVIYTRIKYQKMSRIVTLQDLKKTEKQTEKQRELVDADFFKQEVKKYEELCVQLAGELKKIKIKSFSNEHYIKELEKNYKDAMKKLKELNLKPAVNVMKPSGGSEFIKNMKEYLTKDLALSEQDIQKIKEENLRKIRSLTISVLRINLKKTQIFQFI